MRKVGIGVIGCGVISTAYLKAMQRFPILELKAVADMRSEAAETCGATFGVPGMKELAGIDRAIDELLVQLGGIVLRLSRPASDEKP